LFPKSFKKLIENFSSLPSVGPKMAERLFLFLFKQDKEKIKDFADNLLALQKLSSCQRCFNIAEEDFCEICKNKARDQKTICVVEEPLDIISIERTGIYHGLYHVLGGVIFASTGKDDDLKIPQLLSRLKNEKIKEVIIAANPTTEGDATALYLKRKIQPLQIHPVKSASPSEIMKGSEANFTGQDGPVLQEFNRVKVTRLARGLSTGGDIEYADELTLSEALTNRKELV
jgi:recombination protein RecR